MLIGGLSNREFLMEFNLSGPGFLAKNDDGKDIKRLWRIWNKCTMETADGDLCYEVQYWENDHGHDYVYAWPAGEIKSNYPTDMDAWEENYGDAWDAKYGTVGKIWNASGQATKRPFDDTPGKARKELKKQKITVKIREFDSEVDEEVDEEMDKEKDDADPFVAPPPRQMNQFEIRVPSFRADVPSAPMADENVEMSSSVAGGTARTECVSRGLQDEDVDVSDLLSPLARRPGASSPLGVNRHQTSSLGSPAQQSRLLSRSLLSDEVEDSEMNDLDSLKSNLTFQAAPTNTVSRNATTRSILAVSHASDSLTPEYSQNADQTMDDALQAVYEESQLEFAAARDAETGSESPSGQFDPSQRVIEENQFENYSQKLIDAHSESVEGLFLAALDLTDMPCDDCVTKRKEGSKCDYTDFISYLVVILLGMDALVLEHFVKGDLPKAEKRNAALQKTLRKLKNLGPKEKCLSIYAQYLVDKNGESPCTKVLLEVLGKAELYLQGRDEKDLQSGTFSVRVDSIIGKPWSLTESVAGKRKYIKDEARAEKCLAWIENVKHRLSSLPADQPLERPLAEVGYATTPIERLDQHARHSSSNYLMNLCEAICRVLYGHRYSIEQYVVFHNFHLTHAMYAEIVLSRIGLVYTTQGGGFSHHPAGISQPGANGVGKNYYTDLEERSFADSDFLELVESELRRKNELAELYKGLVTTAAEQEALVEDLRLLKRSIEQAMEEDAQQKERLKGMLKDTEPFMKLLQLVKEL